MLFNPRVRSDEIILILERTLEADQKRRLVPTYYFKYIPGSGWRRNRHRALRVANTDKLLFDGNIGYISTQNH